MSSDISEALVPRPARRSLGEGRAAKATPASEPDVSRERALPVYELLDAGLDPVFIAHYRRSVTGGMDEAAVRRLAAARKEREALETLRHKARRQAKAAGTLSDDLDRAIAETTEPEILEDLIRLYGPKRRTAGVVAEQRGLGPLADYAMAAPPDGPALEIKAAEFVHGDKEVRSPEEALAGASHILAERFAGDLRIRQAVRRLVLEKGILKSAAAKGGGKKSAEVHGHSPFQETIGRLPPHRVLAINRGERLKALKVTIEVPAEELRGAVLPLVVPPDHRFREFLERAATDAIQRLVLPAIDRDVRRQLTLRAESHAIEVFAANLRSLLMARPVRNKRVLAIQPGFRTGSKIAVLDRDGSLLGETIIYPFEPQKKWAEGRATLAEAIQQHGVRVIAIGNGTGCREVEQLVSETLETMPAAGGQAEPLDVRYAIISEAGAALYADSNLAKAESPNLDAAIRATISIGRRLQDPLAELVKIDPRAIGVGLYQHDVNQERLRQALEDVMVSCVAAVGADANTASAAMLRRIPGLGPRQVSSLLARRAKAPLANRDELRSLDGWDERTYRVAAGFLRVRGPNPLDATGVHPEQYADAARLLAHIGHSAEDLKTAESAGAICRRLSEMPLEPLAEALGVPLLDLMGLVGALEQADGDPRSSHHGPVFRKRMRQIKDLAPGMWVKGTVRNVVDFGAFVDIGLKEDGLVHISQFSRRYVRNPLKFLHVGDVVDVRLLSVDPAKHRISLTLLPEPSPKKTEPKPAAPAAPAQAGAPAGAPSPSRRPAARQPAAGKPAASSGGARRGPASSRPPQGRRPPHSTTPRVIVSKSPTDTGPREADERGRPKIRWAYYDSDLPTGQAGAEESDMDSELPDAAESPETETHEAPPPPPLGGQAPTETPENP
jgi:uncharacterized protein